MTLPAINNKLTEPKKWVLLTYAGSKHFITDKQEAILRRSADNDRIYTDKGMVRVATVKEILPLEEYYLAHPEEKPEAPPKLFQNTPAQPFTKDRRIRALESMIRGISGYIESDRYQGTDKPIKLRELMTKRLEEAKLSSAEEFENPVKEIRDFIF